MCICTFMNVGFISCTGGTAQQMPSSHHLLHTVPVNQSVWISEVSLVVLVISHNKLATETHRERLTPTCSASLFHMICCKRHCLLGLQEKLLVEGLVLVAPLVSTAPAGVAAISEATVTSARFKGKVQQVVQAYLFRSSKLSRAKLGPACLCYLERHRRRTICKGQLNFKINAVHLFHKLVLLIRLTWCKCISHDNHNKINTKQPLTNTNLLASSSTCNAILSPSTSLRGSLVKSFAFL